MIAKQRHWRRQFKRGKILVFNYIYADCGFPLEIRDKGLEMPSLPESGRRVLTWVRLAGLMVIATATVVAFGFELTSMITARMVNLADLLLLFIYLEVMEMVAINLSCGKLPVRMPIYIAIIALSRYLILDIKGLSSWNILSVAVATLILALAILALRYGHIRFPYDKGEDCAEPRFGGFTK